MTKVLLEGRMPGWRLHSLYDSLIRFPPQGYEIVVSQTTRNAMDRFVRNVDSGIRTYRVIRPFVDIIKPFMYYGLYGLLNMHKDLEVQLTYSSQHLVFRNEPWVVDLEFVTALVGYGRIEPMKKVVQKLLASKNCKRIIPWTEAGKKTLFYNLDCRNFEDKTETVHLAVAPKDFVKKLDHDGVRILFVGTGNPFNLRRSFELKGGREALEAFKLLLKSYSNVELTTRSVIPSEFLGVCKQLARVRVLHNILTRAELDREFRRADIFWFPSHQTPGLTILDAMGYELPVIATNIWANPEMVRDGRTGFLIRPGFARYWDERFLPLWGQPEFFRLITKVGTRMVNDLVEKTSKLIDDPNLRRQMGRAGRQIVDHGEFSIVSRNRKLERIFNEAVAE